MIRILDETMHDVDAREALLDAAFGDARYTKTCERLREGRLPATGLSLVAHNGGALVGTLRFWHVEARGRPMLMLGPLAVASSHEGRGLGSSLIRIGLAKAHGLGHRAVILVGDAPYYARFGFRTDLVERLAMPGPVERARFQGLELVPGALAGATGLVEPTGFEIMPAAAWAEFEAYRAAA
jgi:predicted N-acetyltransferase YhbS